MAISALLLAILIIVYGALWGGIWWRMRGGALTGLSGWDPGTGGMRAIAAVALAAPLVAIGGWWWALMIPALWIGWSIAGWGCFQGMGKSPIGVKNPVERLLSRHFAPVPMCFFGMAIEGAYCMALPGIAAGWITASWPAGLAVMLAGLGFAPIYYYAQHLHAVPDLGRFEHAETELAECLVGAWIGLTLTAIALAYAP